MLNNHNTIRFLVIGLLVGMMTSSGISQNTAFWVNVDFAQFKYTADRNYLEIYYSFGEDNLTYLEKDGQTRGAMILNATVLASNDSVILARGWRVPHTLTNKQSIENSKQIVGVIGIEIPHNQLQLKIDVTDENNTTRTQSFKFPISAKTFRVQELSISDIELCTSIKKNPDVINNTLFKNNYEVTPNPSRQYITDKPFLYFYLELYNPLGEHSQTNYLISKSIYNSDQKIVITKESVKTIPAGSSVDVGFFNCSDLKPGEYLLKYSISDSTTGKTETVTKSFYLIDVNQLSQLPASNYDTFPVYLRMSASDLDLEIVYIQYLLTANEKNLSHNLHSVESKKVFLTKFWDQRMSIPGTEKTIIRSEYLNRIQLANSQFGSREEPGWKTDRGRVFVLYGPPNEKDYFPTEIDSKPYEIWSYNELLGGVIFVFADLSGFNNYLLIHSTHRNEIRDDNWRNLVLDKALYKEF